MSRRVFITGGAGYLGSKLVRRLIESAQHELVVADIRDASPFPESSHLTYQKADVRDAAGINELIARHRPEVVIHLAAIVDPPKGSTREFEYSVDVGGTRNVLDACVKNGVRRIVITSSGAAYGYYADNPEWLRETDPTRGNEEFAYAWHKRLVEQMLAEHRESHPKLEQIIFRVGTILGEGVRNQITNLFDPPRLLGVRGGDDRFVFIWDEDVVAILERAIDSPVTGIFNVAGDGAVASGELARRMNKPYLRLPAGLLRLALGIAKPLGLSRYGPEQVKFLQFRPVLDNAKLKSEFGYTPRKTSSEVFDFFLESRADRKS